MRNRFLGLVCSSLFAIPTVGCNLLDTADDEGTSGRGAEAFSPYEGGVSGAVRLALQVYNGCALAPNLQPYGKGNANFPYPECKLRADNRSMRLVEDPSLPAPTRQMTVRTGTKYFLDRLTLIQSVWNAQSGPFDVPTWIRSTPPFSKLDWSGLAMLDDKYLPSVMSISPTTWMRQVTFAGASWEGASDEFKVELLDADGAVRSTAIYKRNELLVENSATKHTMLKWVHENIAAPTYPGDPTVQAPPTPPPGYPPTQPISTHSLFKLELVTSTNPTQTLTVEDTLAGDGAFRVTWSQLPDDPFYIPVRFERPEDAPATCYDAANPDQRVQCDFGLKVGVEMSTPENGTFYQPGETMQFTLRLTDGKGNLLHAPDLLPSPADYYSGASDNNGLVYMNVIGLVDLQEEDGIPAYNISGPRHEMRVEYELNEDTYYQLAGSEFSPGVGGEGAEPFFQVAAVMEGIPGGMANVAPTTVNIPLPADLKPGTYNLFVKFTRAFNGERTTKSEVFAFQVGQAEPTSFPNRVGNCQLCHRGVLSLDNVRHSMAVDFVEGCKTCHNRHMFATARNSTQSLIHDVHMTSNKYPMAKNDCTVCHLTRESTLRPSMIACESCHPNIHGGKYEELKFQSEFIPGGTTVYGNCANSCHVLTAPTQHILPPQ